MHERRVSRREEIKLASHVPPTVDEHPTHLSRARLTAGLPRIRRAPEDYGYLCCIVRRPAVGEREVLSEGALDPAVGLAGDNWLARGCRLSPDGSAIVDMQLTVMNIRVAELVADGWHRVPLAGDQLYVDLDLSIENLPPGTMLAIGPAVVQVSCAPHLGCKKFVERFGPEAMRFVNSRLGRQLRLRGMNVRIIRGGAIQVGDAVVKHRSAEEV